MSFVVKLIIGGWISTFAIIGVCALNESGKLLKFRHRLASWIEAPEASSTHERDEGLEPEGESAA
jgi:hypothetical protein